jgi:hypothetical protein
MTPAVHTHGPSERISEEQFTGKKWAWTLYIDEMYMNTSIPKREPYSILLQQQKKHASRYIRELINCPERALPWAHGSYTANLEIITTNTPRLTKSPNVILLALATWRILQLYPNLNK